MTIPSTPRRAGPLLGNGVTTSFPFSFKVFAPTDVKVVIANSAGVETVLALNSDYTVTLNANQDTSPGGTITYPISGSPLPSGSVLSITGDLDYDQPLDLPSGGNFSPLALENQLDRTTMQIQQLREEMDRTLKLPVTASGVIDPGIPTPESNKLLGWDETAERLRNYGVSEIANTLAFSNWLVDSFTGDGTTTDFGLSQSPGALANVLAVVDGLVLTPGVDYTIAGSVLSFTVAPTPGAEISVRYGTALPQTPQLFTRETFTATGGQTLFTLQQIVYTPGTQMLAVYVNGLRMTPVVDYFETGFNSFTFRTGLTAGDEVLVIAGTEVSVGSGQAASTAYLPAGAGAVPTNVEAKLREVVSVKDFGAVGDGVTDDRLAFQRAFDYVNAVGGGVVYIPPGRYRKADTPGGQWVMYSNTTLRGAGDSSVIFWDDRDTVARSGNDMLRCDNTVNVAFENFKIEGSLDTYTNETNQKQTLTGTNITNLRISNVTITKVRYMATAFSAVNDGQVIGCRFADVLRDGVRFTQSQNIRIVGNQFVRVADDAVALHSRDDSSAVMAQTFVVSDNTFDACQGIKILGAKSAIISNNNMRRMLRNPILIDNEQLTTPEGNTPIFAITISNNVILDTFGVFGTDYVIRVKISNRSKAALSTQPGANSTTFGYNYENDVDAANKVNVGAYGIQIANNTIGWTLARGVNYSSYGYGLLLDRRAAPNFGYIDPALTDTSYCCTGVSVIGPVRGLLIDGNIFYGGSRNGTARYPAISLTSDNAAANTIVITDAIISRNVITDWIGQVALFLDHQTTNGARHISVVDNWFNLDPFFRHPDHSAVGNTWATDDSLAAIDANSRIYGGTVSRNHFKNCSRLYSTGGNPFVFRDNYVYFQPNGGLGLDGASTNRGVRYVPSNPRVNCIIIDGDPASATFDTVLTIPVNYASSMPTSGTYVYGHVVEASVPILSGTTPNRYLVSGWRRITTGSGNVLNTDWLEIRTPTGT